MTFYLRLCFVFTVLAGVVFAILNPQAIQVDTNLNDLNPEKVNDPGLQHALDSLTKDVSQRFVIVVTGEDKHETNAAADSLQTSLSTLPGLMVVNNDSVLQDFLPVITPYRFNFLTEAQRDNLINKSETQIAEMALRNLYQLGDGVRLIPFEEDPLGWFSDYLIEKTGDIDIPEEANDEGKSVVSFSVVFNDFPRGMAEQNSLFEQINAAERAVSQAYDVNILHSGMFFFAVDSAQSAKADIQLIAVGSMAGVLLLMLLVFRSLLPLLLAFSSIAAGVGFGVLTSVWVFGSVHVLTIVFGASLIGIVVDYSLHYFYHFLADKNAPDAAESSRDGQLFRAMLLSVITSLVGYGALSLTDLLILKKVALFSCSGLAMAWLSVMILGPFVVRRPIDARQAMLKSFIYGCQRVFARKPRVLTTSGVILAGLSLVYILTGSLNVNDDPRRFFHVSSALLEQEQAVSTLAQVYEPGRYLLIRGQQAQQIYDALEALYRYPGVNRESVTGITDWLASPQAQARYYALQAGLYGENGALDSFSSLLGLPPDSFSLVKKAYITAKESVLGFSELAEAIPALPPLWSEQDGQIYSFALIRKNSDLKAIADAAEAVPEIDYVNTLSNATRALKSQRETGATLLLVAYLLVALLLAFWYRKATAALMLLIPACASLIAVALVLVSGQAINVFHIMALFLVLGLGMDYIIFAKEMASKPDTTQQAILLSAVTSLLSFGLLAFSAMPVVQAFGSIILIGNTINFIAAISLFNGEPEKKEEEVYV